MSEIGDIDNIEDVEIDQNMGLDDGDNDYVAKPDENDQELANMDSMDIDLEEEEEDDDLDVAEEDNDDEEEDYKPVEGTTNTSKQKTKHTKGSNLAARRGRPRLKEIDELPEDYEVIDDEIVTEDDPKGDTKIDSLGNLTGGRQFRVKTFKLPDKGDKLYAISTDVARSVGYRDSYFLFQRHIRLFRVTLNEDVKMELIRQGVLPTQFKTRHAYLVAARSMFKEFGAKLIFNGKQVVDDYYEDAARNAGSIEGAPVSFNTDIYNGPNTSNALAEKQRNLTVLVSNNVVSDSEVSWMYDHAMKTRQFESMMLFDRSEVLKSKIQRDVYTGLNFVPDFTQPTKAQWRKVGELDNEMMVDTILVGNNVVKTGLSSVPLEIFEGCVDEETKAAILQQQQWERNDFL